MPFIKTKHIVKVPTSAFIFIMEHFGCSQAQAQRFIAKGRLFVDEHPFLNSGDFIKGNIDAIHFEAKSRGLRPIFNTLDFMVYDKPTGVLVHPNTIHTEYSMLDEIRAIAGNNVNALHRIDMETSGLLLASKHKNAEKFIKNKFEMKTIQKTYIAWVDGKVEKNFSVDMPILVNNTYELSKHKVLIDRRGKSAQTDFELIYYDDDLDASLLICRPLTGRTHQIRVHLFHMKHPILGDPIYGTSFKASDSYLNGEISDEERDIETGANRLMLHAQSLSFEYGANYFIESKINFIKKKEGIYAKNGRRFNKN